VSQIAFKTPIGSNIILRRISLNDIRYMPPLIEQNGHGWCFSVNSRKIIR